MSSPEHEKYLLVFTSFNLFDSFKRAFSIDPQFNHETNIGTVQYQDKHWDITVNRSPNFNTLRHQIEPTNYCKVLIMDSTISSIRNMPLNWYIIKSLSEFEEALQITCTAQQSFILTRQQRSYSIPVPLPLIHVLQQLLNFDGIDDQAARHAPETRTPLNAEWSAKLEQQQTIKPKEKDEEEQSLCVVCLTNDPCIMLTPCSHQCVCDICVKELLERDDQKKQCPVCREKIENIFKPIK